MITRQEIYCHECQMYVQFNIDISLNGNHILNCPNCGHEHCRVVENGIITDLRWGRRNNNLPVFMVSVYSVTTSGTSTYDNYTAGGTGTGTSNMTYGLWMDSATGA